MKNFGVIAVVFALVYCVVLIEAEEELDDDNVRDVYAEPTRQIMQRWIDGRPLRIRNKRMKRKQHKRILSEEFYYDDRLDHFVPSSQWNAEQMDSPIRIRIRLRRRGPVKRQAKKVLMEFAEDREMDSIAKEFLQDDDDSLAQVLRDAVHTYRRADRLALNGHQRRGLRVKVSRRTKRRSY